MCLGTNVSRHKRVWAQMCLGTNVTWHKRVWAQTCLGTNVCGDSRVGSIMYGHKRVEPFIDYFKTSLSIPFIWNEKYRNRLIYIYIYIYIYIFIFKRIAIDALNKIAQLNTSDVEAKSLAFKHMSICRYHVCPDTFMPGWHCRLVCCLSGGLTNAL